MKQTPLERQLVLDVQVTRAGGFLTQAGLWRWEHVMALAREASRLENLKRRDAQRLLGYIPILYAGVRA